jgi:hypothetical protein
MALSALEILYLIELIIYTPALVASLFVVKKHGAGKKLEWRFLTMVSLFRLVGAATGIAAIHHPSQGLSETSDIMQSLGFSSLLAAAIGILTRVNDTMKNRALPPGVFAVLGLPLLAGLIVSIIGSTSIFDNEASNWANGYTYLKAGICLFAAGFIGIVAITIHDVVRISHVEHGSRRLLFTVAGSLPFLAVLLIYKLVCIFTEGGKWFSMFSTFWGAVTLHGVIGVLPEFVMVVLYLFSGLTAPALNARPWAKEGEAALAV